MPERGSRDLSEEEESYLISQEEAAAWQAGHIAASSSSSITSDTQSAEYVDLYEYPVVDRDCESEAALDWSCTNDFLSTVPAEGHDPMSAASTTARRINGLSRSNSFQPRPSRW